MHYARSLVACYYQRGFHHPPASARCNLRNEPLWTST